MPTDAPAQSPLEPRKPSEFLGRPKPLAVALWIALGVVLVYSSTWVGPVTFYLSFQRFLEGESAAGGRRIVWALPVAAADSAPLPKAAVEYRQLGDLLVPLPSGAPTASERKDSHATVTYPEGRVRYDFFPERFVRDLYAEQLEAIGGKPGDAPETADEVKLLKAIMGTDPGAYRFGWGAAERSEYAARVLSKMRLLRDLPLRRLELSERAEPRAVVVLAEYESGEATVLAVTRRGSVVVQLSETAPEAWKASPALWFPKERARPVDRHDD